MSVQNSDGSYYLPRLDQKRLDCNFGIGGLIDVETTGLSPHTDEIIEFAMVLFAFERSNSRILGIVDEYIGLREPACRISPGAARVNGISEFELRGKVLDESKITTMIEKAEFLIAHNATFDKSFVCKLFRFASGKPWYCSMKGINWYQKGCQSRSLQNLLQKHNIKVLKAHRADADVQAVLSLLAQNNADGSCYFTELLQSGKGVG